MTARRYSLLALPTRNGCVVGCGEPPAGSSDTAIATNASRSSGYVAVCTAEPDESGAKVPAPTGVALVVVINQS
jgi:hypothetical protein